MKKLILALSIVLSGCGYQSENDLFFQKATDALKSKQNVKISEIVDLNFDEVCIFQVSSSSNISATDLLKDDIRKKGIQTNVRLYGKNLIWSFRENKRIIKNYSHKNGYFDTGNKHIGMANKSGEISFQFCGDEHAALTVTDTHIVISD